MTKQQRRQHNIDRLAQAITFMRERNMLTTRANIKSVANRFAVHWKSLSLAFEIEARMKAHAMESHSHPSQGQTKPTRAKEGEELARLSRGKKPNRLSSD